MPRPSTLVDARDYQPLLPDSPINGNISTSDLSRDGLDHEANLPSKRANIYHFVLVVFCMTCTVVNVAVLWNIKERPLSAFLPLSQLSYAEIDSLKAPSQFIGLDDVYRVIPHRPRNFTNHPLLLAPIDSNQPLRVFNNDTEEYVKDIGTISPQLRQARLSPTISTIVQFMAIDYMMETCELHLTFSNRTDIYKGKIELFQLNEKHRVHEDSINYSNRPMRARKVDEITLSAEVPWAYRFTCPRETLFTFEIACPEWDKACQLEWSQDMSNVTGIVMIQIST